MNVMIQRKREHPLRKGSLYSPRFKPWAIELEEIKIMVLTIYIGNQFGIDDYLFSNPYSFKKPLYSC